MGSRGSYVNKVCAGLSQHPDAVQHTKETEAGGSLGITAQAAIVSSRSCKRPCLRKIWMAPEEKKKTRKVDL